MLRLESKERRTGADLDYKAAFKWKTTHVVNVQYVRGYLKFKCTKNTCTKALYVRLDTRFAFVNN